MTLTQPLGHQEQIPFSLPGRFFLLARLDEQCGAIPTRTLHFEKHWRLLESMKAQYVAGNGFRKVSCVVSVCRLLTKSYRRKQLDPYGPLGQTFCDELLLLMVSLLVTLAI